MNDEPLAGPVVRALRRGGLGVLGVLRILVVVVGVGRDVDARGLVEQRFRGDNVGLGLSGDDLLIDRRRPSRRPRRRHGRPPRSRRQALRWVRCLRSRCSHVVHVEDELREGEVEEEDEGDQDDEGEQHDDRVVDDLASSRPRNLAQLAPNLARERDRGGALRRRLGSPATAVLRCGPAASPSGPTWPWRCIRRFCSRFNSDLLNAFGSRAGGTRTPNRRFWRPVLYQLSHCPKPRLPGRMRLAPGLYRVPSRAGGGLSWRRREPAAGPPGEHQRSGGAGGGSGHRDAADVGAPATGEQGANCTAFSGLLDVGEDAGQGAGGGLEHLCAQGVETRSNRRYWTSSAWQRRQESMWVRAWSGAASMPSA